MQEIFENILKELKNELNKVQSKCKSIAIKDGRSLDYEFYGGKSEAYTKAVEIVEQAATDYNGGWISCSERLPEEGRGVILYVENKAHKGSHVMFMANIHNGEWQMWETSRQTEINYTPIAWQPLPQPYQPKGE